MPGLVNIAKEGAQPVFINASDITNVSISGEGDKASLAIIGTQGLVAGYENKNALDYYNVDPQEALRRLIDAGAPLVHFPSRWLKNDGESYETTDNYINPAAVNYVTVGGSHKLKDKKAVTLMFTGAAAPVESLNNTPEENEALLAAIRAAKTMREYKSDEAYATGTWDNPESFFVDPKAVTGIIDKQFQTSVQFDNPNWWLDVQAQNHNADDHELEEKIANEIASSTPVFGGGRDLQSIFNEAKERVAETKKAARFKFADDLAAANGTLVSIPSPDAPLYIHKEAIGTVTVDDKAKPGEEKRIIINAPRKAGADRSDPIMIYYTDDKDGQKIVKALSDALEAPAAHPAKKARPSPPKAKQG